MEIKGNSQDQGTRVGDSRLQNTRRWEDGRTGPETLLRWSVGPDPPSLCLGPES